MQEKIYETTLGKEKLSATFSNLADQTNGAVVVRLGDTVVLVTAVMSETEKEDQDWFPLTVDYEEKFYAVGKILGGRFNKREGKPSDEAILTGRIIDRTIRPLFNQKMRREVQVVATVLSSDEKNDPSVPAIIGASLALATSDIPWAGPVGGVRLGLTKDNPDEFIINPSNEISDDLILDTLICGKGEKINMIEARAMEVTESKLGLSYDLAVAEITKLENWQKDIIADIGKPKTDIDIATPSEEVKKLFTDHIESKLSAHVFSGEPNKNKIKTITKEWQNILTTNKVGEVSTGLLYLEDKIDEALHIEGIKNKKRADGRAEDELRPIFCQAGGLTEVIHGSGIFFRGGTHILSILTLAGPKDSLLIEGMEISGAKHFMHHYNFPPFSVGETGRLGGLNRRAIGHGALAEKSLEAVLPDRVTFPYTIRLVSEAMASNGSTSMGSVCASSLALMEGGVPIKRPVAGIAMGLMYGDENNYMILTDIQGPEDHYGDMDFKVAGTTEGVTGIQLDIKVDGISPKILKEALTQAKTTRLKIIDKILEAIPASRPEVKASAPHIETIKILPDQIGNVIGSGGKTIQKITEDSGAEINIEDDGSIFIAGHKEAVATAKKIILEMTHEYKTGEQFSGIVTKVTDFGAFVKIGHNTEGLVHVSEMAPFRIEVVSDYLKIGDTVPVEIKDIDSRQRLSLSIKKREPNFFEAKKI